MPTNNDTNPPAVCNIQLLTVTTNINEMPFNKNHTFENAIQNSGSPGILHTSVHFVILMTFTTARLQWLTGTGQHNQSMHR